MRLRSIVSLAFLTSLLFSTSAQAHDQLLDIDPAPKAILEEGSFTVTLTFDNPLLEIAGESNAELSTRLVGADDWVSHEVSIDDRVLTAEISLSEPGDYELRWQVVSSDGHPITGESSFTLNVPAPTTGDEPIEPVVIAPNPSGTDSSNQGSLTGFYIGLAMVALGAVFAPIGLLMRRRAKKSGV
jgi:copper resistance protein C